jgi:hypothetical protein
LKGPFFFYSFGFFRKVQLTFWNSLQNNDFQALKPISQPCPALFPGLGKTQNFFDIGFSLVFALAAGPTFVPDQTRSVDAQRFRIMGIKSQALALIQLNFSSLFPKNQRYAVGRIISFIK